MSPEKLKREKNLNPEKIKTEKNEFRKKLNVILEKLKWTS